MARCSMAVECSQQSAVLVDIAGLRFPCVLTQSKYQDCEAIQRGSDSSLHYHTCSGFPSRPHLTHPDTTQPRPQPSSRHHGNDY